VSIFSEEEKKIEYFSSIMNAGRILVNTPSSQGALGGTFNALQPSLTLACGSGGKNITTDNISVRHLLNIQRIARRRVNECYTCTKKYCTDEAINASLLDEKCQKNLK
jgi:acetaldehyde dehydrogenase/alcohol dehydrogenase